MSAGIDIRGVRKQFGSAEAGTLAIENLDLDIEQGEFVSVVGPSGCGKSTLLRIIAGLTPATAGSVSVFGKPVRGPLTECGIVFQQPILLEWRTIVQNVLFNIDMRGLDAAEYRPRALQLLADRKQPDYRNSIKESISAVEAMARQPEVASKIQTAMMIAAALIEGATFFALIVCIIN